MFPVEIRLQVKVKPNSRVSLLEQLPDGSWLARLKSPPVDGKAKTELLALVAAHFSCRKSAVAIKYGKSGRIRLLAVKLEAD
ncbi:MAG: DUF167 domain-containing protein [Synechococcales cyanobacterium T60_A2020_003]|nr:DUF167 domain-containing protein [Synechococcales cyanobacterium T60_A2020_003]